MHLESETRMETDPLPEARLRMGRRWFLKDAGFLKRLGAAFTFFGASALMTIPRELAEASQGWPRSFYWASNVVGIVGFFLAVYALTRACCRALLPRFGELKPLRSVRDRFIVLLLAVACYGFFFTALILVARTPMAWRGAAGFAALFIGAFSLVRAQRPVL